MGVQGRLAARGAALLLSMTLPLPAFAQTAPALLADEAPLDIDVTSKRLDIARQQIEPSLGATNYRFDPQALHDIPQGENANLNQVVLQSPGVWQDAFGQIHIRGEHGNVQYRIDGVQFPEGLSFFGQALESRFANSVSVLTGSLPAQYGINTAGVIDIQTKTGFTSPGLAVTMYGGSWDWLQPSFQEGGHGGPVDWFISGDYLHNNRGIDNPAPTYDALHDTTNQFHGFAHVSGILDENTRISLLAGAYSGQFQIPNVRFQIPQFTPVNGISTFNSALLNEQQQEAANFIMLALQKHTDTVDAQVALFARNNYLHFTPDPLGDLLFNGISQNATRSDFAAGMQTDVSWHAAENHTIRGGVQVQGERATFSTLSSILPATPDGVPTSDIPFNIGQGGGKTGWLYGLYLQDEWQVRPHLTINYGARLDLVDAFTHASQLSPRVNVVWQPTDRTTLHAGYARYFAPPALEAVAQADIFAFRNTTATPTVFQNDPVQPERSNYFDAGITQKLLPGWQVGLDAFYKNATNEGDVGQFGAPIILTAFSYAEAKIYGGEVSTSYRRGPWSIYGNAGWSKSQATGISSAQFNFAPDELAYINSHWIYVDHDQRWTASGGIAYTLNRDSNHSTLLSTDFLYSSGLRATVVTPNDIALPSYAVVNMSAVQKLPLGLGSGTELQFDILNLFDKVYQIRNGTGVSVGASQYGLRRTFLAGLTQRF